MQATWERRGWVVVLPVKGGTDAKSRLRPGPDLAAAIAADCLDAVLSTPSARRVLVVTGDGATAAAAGGAGAEVVRQPASQPGLDAAVAAGLAATGEDGPVAVLLADLPALRPEDLDGALRLLQERLVGERADAAAAFVPDHDGVGTVLLAGLRADRLRPRFGAGSAAAHEAAGALRADLDLPRLRRDVDTAEDLAAALLLGVGPRTARTLEGVQATVIRYDAVAGTGEVVTDDGLRLPMSPGAVDRSGLRHLRAGQRVSCEAVLDVGSPVAVTRVRVQGVSG